MPRTRREEVAAVVTLMVFTQGIHFDAHTLSNLPYSRPLVWRVVKALVDGGVIVKVRKGKYLVTDGFAELMKREITWKMPRGVLLSLPDLRVFDVCGMEIWDREELEAYIGWMRKRWESNHLRVEPERTQGSTGSS